LSLNGSDPMLGNDLTLREHGIVGSDLLTVLTGDVAFAAQIQK